MKQFKMGMAFFLGDKTSFQHESDREKEKQNDIRIEEHAKPLLAFLKESGIWHDVAFSKTTSKRGGAAPHLQLSGGLLVDFAGVRPGISHEFYRIVFCGDSIVDGCNTGHSFCEIDRRSTLNYLINGGRVPNLVRSYICDFDALSIAQGLKP